MTQPIKNKKDVNYESYFSRELYVTLEHLRENISNNNIQITEISIESLIFSCLQDDENILSYIFTEDERNKYIEKLHILILEKSVSAIRPGRKIDYNTELIKSFINAYNVMKNYNFNSISSDLWLYSVLDDKTNKSKIKSYFNKDEFFDRMMTYREINIDEQKQQKPNKQSQIILDNGFFGQQMGIPNTSKNEFKTYCIDMNEQCRNNEYNVLIGRDKEINDICHIFGRRNANNALLIGESGVGKTAIVEGMAHMIEFGYCPIQLHGYTIYKLNITALTSNTTLRGMLESRLELIQQELSKNDKNILFIDDFHKISQVNNEQEGGNFVSNIFSILQNKKIKVIVSTSNEGYNKVFVKDKELERRFQKIYVNELNDAVCEDIIKNNLKILGKYHNVKYDTNMILDVITLCKRYLSDKKLPASAIDLLDESASQKRNILLNDVDIIVKRNVLRDKVFEYETFTGNNDVVDDEIKLKTNINNLKVSLKNKSREIMGKDLDISINIDDIYKALSIHTEIPISKLKQTEKETLKNLSETLKNEIIGQDESIDYVCQAIKRGKLGLTSLNHPIFSGFMIGPSGCGKTLLAKKLAKELFGDENKLIRFDMSEYSDKTATNKLIGSSAGYVGYDKGGILTKQIQRHKNCVLLFDEIEKANEEVYNLMLQILDEGCLSDNNGNKVDFKNTIVIFTSNIGTKNAENTFVVGFNRNADEKKKSVLEKDLKAKFPPEFLNRLDKIIYFNKLSNNNIKDIIKIELNKLLINIDNNLHIKIIFDNKDDIIEYVYNNVIGQQNFNGRTVVRAIQDLIENIIVDYVIDNDNDIKEMCIFIEENKLKIK